MSSGKLLLGVVAGVTVGVLLGVLFTQEKNSDSQKRTPGEENDYADKIKEKFNEFLDGISEKTENAK